MYDPYRAFLYTHTIAHQYVFYLTYSHHCVCLDVVQRVLPHNLRIRYIGSFILRIHTVDTDDVYLSTLTSFTIDILRLAR